MTKKLIIEQIRKILESGDFDSFIGHIENDHLDGKMSPYRLDDEKTKYELAKDVIAFANGGGGFIVMGLRTERSESHHGDEVVGVSPFDRSLVDDSRYRNILDEWVYPSIDALRLEWWNSHDGSGKGIVSIEVPIQNVSKRPFLIKKHVDENGVHGLFFSLYERRSEDSKGKKVEEIHSMIRDGMILRRMLDYREEIVTSDDMTLGERKPDAASPSPNAASPSSDSGSSIINAVEAVGIRNVPHFVMAAFPIYSQVTAEVIKIDLHSIKDLVENPPVIREAGFGFDLHTGEKSKIIEAQARRSSVPEERGIEVRRNGAIIFVGHCELLTHKGKLKDNDILYTMNPLGLVESAYLFVKFCDEIYTSNHLKPIRVSWSFLLNNVKSESFKCGLIGGSLKDWGWKYRSIRDVMLPPKNECSLGIEAELDFEDDCVGTVAYQILREVYAWYGFEEKEIPYVSIVDSRRRIDPALILAAGK